MYRKLIESEILLSKVIVQGNLNCYKLVPYNFHYRIQDINYNKT